MAEERRLARLAGAALLLVAAVVVVSAAIRLGQVDREPLTSAALAALRGVHRVSASLDALAVFALAWLAWRVRAARPALARTALFALALTLGLSTLGVAGGTTPGARIALGNLLGGLALAGVLAWALGLLQRGQQGAAPSRLARAALALAFVQCALGGWIAVIATEIWSLPLAIHALLGALLALGALRIGALLGPGPPRRAHRARSGARRARGRSAHRAVRCSVRRRARARRGRCGADHRSGVHARPLCLTHIKGLRRDACHQLHVLFPFALK
jgi:hypothetical protein